MLMPLLMIGALLVVVAALAVPQARKRLSPKGQETVRLELVGDVVETIELPDGAEPLPEEKLNGADVKIYAHPILWVRQRLVNWMLKDVRILDELHVGHDSVVMKGQGAGDNHFIQFNTDAVGSGTPKYRLDWNDTPVISAVGHFGVDPSSGEASVYDGNAAAQKTIGKYSKYGTTVLDHGTAPANGELLIRTGTDITGQATGTGSGLDADTLDGLDSLAFGVLASNQNWAGNNDFSAGVTTVATPTNPTDAATKAYVDASSSGLDVKDNVSAASTADLAGAVYNNVGGTGGAGEFTSVALSIDGVTLAVGDSVLVKDQTNKDENGIYEVTAVAGTITMERRSDADTTAEMNEGAFTFVSDGATNKGAGFVLLAPFTVAGGQVVGGPAGNDQDWSQFSDAGAITAGAGMVQSGSAFDVVAADASLQVNANDIALNLQATPGLVISGSGVAVLADATKFMTVGAGGVAADATTDAKANPSKLLAADGSGDFTASVVTVDEVNTGDINYANSWKEVEDFTPPEDIEEMSYDEVKELKKAATNGLRWHDDNGQEIFAIRKDGLYFYGQKFVAAVNN